MEQEDFFNTLVCLCAETNQTRIPLSIFQYRAFQQIRATLEERERETSKLYNPFKNLYLDKCYGESLTPLGSWMDFSNYMDE